jgi:xanthine dehydrogenase YagT iron-sulfur-binding subunit
MEMTITVTVDGEPRTAAVDTRVTVLDLLREHLGVVAPKKGCDHGQCDSCTVLLNGRRVTTCLALAVQHDGAEIITAAGLGDSRAAASGAAGVPAP